MKQIRMLYKKHLLMKMTWDTFLELKVEARQAILGSFQGRLLKRIATSKFDVKDLISRLDQELAVRQYLSTKVTELELELETTKQNKEEMVQQAILMEIERATQMQCDIEDFRAAFVLPGVFLSMNILSEIEAERAMSLHKRDNVTASRDSVTA